MLNPTYTIVYRQVPTAFNISRSFTTANPEFYLEEDKHNTVLRSQELVMSPSGKQRLNLIGQGIVIFEVYELTDSSKNIYYNGGTKKCSKKLLDQLKPRIIELMMG